MSLGELENHTETDNCKYLKVDINGEFKNIECLNHWRSAGLGAIIIFGKLEEGNYISLYSDKDSIYPRFRRLDESSSLDNLYTSAECILGASILPEGSKSKKVTEELKKLVEEK